MTPKRLPSLDGWRAVAIVIVLCHHTVFSYNYPFAADPWSSLVFDGNLGVRIFFVISGFLISYLLLNEAAKNGGINLKSFYVRRVFRIFPVYFAYLAVLLILAMAGLYHDSLSAWIGCLTFTRNMVGHNPPTATAHFWSLAVEEQFYLVWPVLLSGLALHRGARRYLGVLVVPIVVCPILRLWVIRFEAVSGVWDRVFYSGSILAYADSLAIGCVGAWLARSVRTMEIAKAYRVVGIPLLLLVIALGRYLEFYHGSRVMYAVVPWVQAWAILGCILLALHTGAAGFKTLNAKPVVAIGVLSYSLYVWHPLFLSSFMAMESRPLLYDWRLWVIPTAITATLSYRLLEKPLMQLRDKWRL